MTATVEATLVRSVRIGSGGPLGDVLIADGRIAALGEVAAAAVGEVIDGRGRTILPGLWDAHVHMLQWASARRRIDLTGARSARQAADLMAAAPDGTEPLIGYGYRDALWPDHPDSNLLDWAGARPVALVSNDLHTTWLNAAALRLIGRNGHAAGVLREGESLDAAERLGAAPAETLDAWVAEAARSAAARGIVGFTDFEHADNLADWTRRARAGQLACRVSATIYPQFLDAAIAAGVRTGDILPGTGGMVEAGPLKVFVDGSLNARTALCNDPYPLPNEDGDPSGLLVTPPDRLRALMARAAEHGIQTAVHAIGDRANTIALDAFDELGCPGRIEHAQLIARADLARVGRPGLVLGVQPAHAADDRDIADQHWAGRTDRAFAYADLLRAGARLEIGSDAPVSPMDPWIGIAAATHRSDDDREPWHPEQSIPLADALAAASRGRRSLRVGDVADLVLVEHDPAELSPAELRRMPVRTTLVAGHCTYRAD
jgi:predicted amidohydrolase YtcJ